MLSERSRGLANASRSTPIVKPTFTFAAYSRSALRVRDFSTILISASTMAPQKAGQKPRTTKAGASRVEANISISALMTHQKSPRVRKVRGKVMSFKKNPSVALTSPITTAAISAATNPRTSNPCTTLDTISRLIALNNQFSSKRISLLSELGSVENHLPRRHGGHGVIGFLSTFLRDLSASVVNFHSYGWAAGSCDTQEIVFFARIMLTAGRRGTRGKLYRESKSAASPPSPRAMR